MEKFPITQEDSKESDTSDVSELGSAVLRARLQYAIEKATESRKNGEKSAE